MKPKLLLLNSALLLLCCSMYLGTGWSLVLFNFSVVDQLTVDNYYLQFVPQIDAATTFFTYMTYVMILSAGIMIWDEWRSHLKWWPIITLVGVMATGWMTQQFIFPYNDLMRQGITDASTLKNVLEQWTMLSKIRLTGWTIDWFAMTAYFSILAYQFKTDKSQ